MLFSSPFFLLLFLPAALTAYWLVPGRLRNGLLLLISLLYYFLSDRSHLSILLLAVAVNYCLALLADRARAGERDAAPGARTKRSGKFVLPLALCFNLGLLLFCKYGSLLPGGVSWGTLHIKVGSLPLGVSFYTFALLSYVLDVHHRRSRAERNPLRFALYVSLFPKMMAGPIARYRDLAAQMARRRFDADRIAWGVQRFILGLGKKVLIANAVAPVADEIFALPHAALTPSVAWLGAVCYSIQIYFDFSGYSDMAIGLGRMFGFDIMENFNYPYISRSIREFWQRWHISLSTWFRDYLFLPLAYGVSRRMPAERVLGVRSEMWAYAVGMLTTMTLCGLWHGASWTFALWGLWHGLFLVLENARWGRRFLKRLGGPPRYVLTQVIVLFGWVIFRSRGFAQIVQFYSAMVGFGGNGQGIAERVSLTDYLGRNLVVALLLGCLFSFPISMQIERWKDRGLARLPARAGRIVTSALALGSVAALMIVLVLCAMSLAGGTYNPFVYRQF
jgi:alginate O-acetyltransferase complex protein AlgI